MLKKIRIRGFRSFSQDSFQEAVFTPVTFIVGENSSGKSNLLEAVKFALDPKNSTIKREDFSIRRSTSSKGKVTEKKAKSIDIELVFDNPRSHFPIEALYGLRHAQEVTLGCRATGRGEGKYVKEFRINNRPIMRIKKYRRLQPEEAAKRVLSRLKYDISPVTRSSESIKELKQLLPMRTSSTSRAALERFERTVQSTFKRWESKLYKDLRKRIAIDAVIDDAGALGSLTLDVNVVDDFTIPLRNSGQGFISDVLLYLFLMRNRGAIVAVEEPEIHKHPNRIRRFVEVVRKQKAPSQVLLTTHSPLLATSAGLDEIVFVSKSGRYTRVQQLNTEGLREDQKREFTRIRAKLFQQYQSTEMLFSSGIILVEGPTDRIAYDLAGLSMDLGLREKGFTIIELGGADSFSPYITLCSLLDIPWVLLLDQNRFIQSGQKGKALQELEKRQWITKDAGEKLLKEWKYVRRRRAYCAEINDQLRKYHGAIVPLPHDDITDAARSALESAFHRAIINDGWYRDVHDRLVGHQFETDTARIKSRVIQGIDDISELSQILERLPPNAMGDIGSSLRYAVQALKKPE